MSRGPRKSKEVREAEARDRELYAMKRSEFKPSLRCKLCGEGSMEVAVPGLGFVCWKCETEARLIVASQQPEETSGPAPDLLGQGKELGGEGQTAQLPLFES